MEPTRRRDLLDKYFEILRAEEAEDDDVDVDQKLDLIFEYQTGFAPVPLSRCPHTGSVAAFGIDTVDLDGLWWNWGAPVRSEDDAPDSYFALSGAMQLGQPIARAPFVARPGPEVPFVVPRLLEIDGMVAVISATGVGPHRGLPVVYFADDRVSPDVERVNDWGCSRYYARTSSGFGSDYVPEDVDEYDWDVGRWIRDRKLFWIAPGDEGLELRQTVDDCPFVGLDGHREIPVILNGEVVWDETG